MAPASGLDRNVRAPVRLDPDEEDRSEEEEEEEEEENEAGSDEDGDEMEAEDSSSEQARDLDNQDDVDDEDDGSPDVLNKLGSVSFGALQYAHAALARKRKRDDDPQPSEQDAKLDALRKRLKTIQEQKTSKSSAQTTRSTTKRARSNDDEDDDGDEASDSDSDSAPSEVGGQQSKSRTSKHAPASQTTRHQVTRKRTVIDAPKRVARDPRFDSVGPPSTIMGAGGVGGYTDRNYAFLRDYQADEVKELKTALRRPGITEDEDYNLRRKINSMENTLKSHANASREQAVRSAHRKEERGRVKEGKRPYFLKEKEVRQRATVEKFRGMKAGEREKVVAKRALKEGQREKRAMPRDRRLGGRR
ncbi:rRNA biogenesis protein rrp36 [Teratosphaeriaceae sp. CCFEE 6253]|nr:rRNA biogenesis protein rrp36 [Teratosphaeriaceae sp. CCFEE 6253]